MVPGNSLPGTRAAGRRRAGELVVAQACRLPEVRGAAVLIAAEDDADALEVVAAAGDHAALRGRFVRADRLAEELGGVSAHAPIGAARGATLAVTADGGSGSDDAKDLARAVGDLATLAGLGWRGAPEVMHMVQAGVGALAKLLALRDGYTGGHAEEVVELCDALALRLGLDAEAVEVLEMAARLHDLGKIGVPDVILHKPGRLTAEEWDVMRKHPGWGADALAAVPGSAAVAAAVRAHHERWDGQGYPDGLAGEEIPIAARIIAVADAWHAMTSNRSYRRALDDEHARAELAEGAGSQFDPRVADALVAVLADRDERFTREPTTAAPPATPSPGPASADRRGRARALATALNRVTRLPALRESRERLDALLATPNAAEADLLDVVEADLALAVAAIRAANALSDDGGPITTVPGAVRALGRDRLADVVADVKSIDYFQQVVGWSAPPEHVRLHALATQRATSLVARAADRTDHDTLMVGALLHDVGKLVLEQLSPAYPAGIHGDADTPDARARAERRALGFDHALVGGLLLRRWVLPEPLAQMVEDHHAEHAEDAAAVLRLADMLAHYAHARPVDPPLLLQAAQAAGLTPQQLRAVMFDLSKAGGDGAPPRATEPSPLTRAQEQVLRGLAAGKVYKEIARDLGLSTSTVRSHCHAVYQRLGVSDRSQAVLQATARGWIPPP